MEPGEVSTQWRHGLGKCATIHSGVLFTCEEMWDHGLAVPKSSTTAQSGLQQRFIYWEISSQWGWRSAVLCVWAGTWNRIQQKRGHTRFSAALLVHETTPKTEWYLKDYRLKEFPQHMAIAENECGWNSLIKQNTPKSKTTCFLLYVILYFNIHSPFCVWRGHCFSIVSSAVRESIRWHCINSFRAWK